ncbi:MAG TPA: hypothetical protein VJR90_08625 [Gammaproteobacteria bacterium]|nr:hypothetical protein [Gammaproteobacteria bacterium]
MRLLLRFAGIILCAVVLLGNTQCQQSSNISGQSDGSPIFVTTLAVESANGVPTTSFTSGESIQFVLSVHNRTNMPQTITSQVCVSQFDIAVVISGTANVVFNGPVPGMQCMAISLDGVPMTFAANETKTFTVIWNQANLAGGLVAPGNYEVMGGVVCWNPPSNGQSAGYDTVNCMAPGIPAPQQLTPTQYRSDLVAFTIQ